MLFDKKWTEMNDNQSENIKGGGAVTKTEHTIGSTTAVCFWDGDRLVRQIVG